MSYTPPAGSSVSFNFSTPYTPPAGGSVAIVFPQEAFFGAAAAASVTVSALLSLPRVLTATASASVVPSVTLVVPKRLAAGPSTSVAVAANLTLLKTLYAGVSAIVSASGALSVPKPLSATIYGNQALLPYAAAPGGLLTFAFGGDYGAPGGSSVSFDFAPLSGTHAYLTVPKMLAAGASSVVATLTDLTVIKGRMVATITTPASVSASLSIPKHLAAAGVALVSVPVTLTTRIAFTARLGGEPLAVASLTVQSIPQPVVYTGCPGEEWSGISRHNPVASRPAVASKVPASRSASAIRSTSRKASGATASQQRSATAAGVPALRNADCCCPDEQVFVGVTKPLLIGVDNLIRDAVDDLPPR